MAKTDKAPKASGKGSKGSKGSEKPSRSFPGAQNPGPFVAPDPFVEGIRDSNSKAPALPAVSEPAVAEVSNDTSLASDEKILAPEPDPGVASTATSTAAPGVPVGQTAERQNIMANLSMKRNDRDRKSLAVVYNLDGHSGRSIRFSKSIFADGEGPAEIPGAVDEAGNTTFTIPAGVLASARAPMSKAESRKAYYEKRKNQTPEQKLEALEKKVEKQRAALAAAKAKQAPAGEQPSA